MKDKIEAQNELKAKEHEEKEVVAQQVITVAILCQRQFDCSERFGVDKSFLRIE